MRFKRRVAAGRYGLFDEFDAEFLKHAGLANRFRHRPTAIGVDAQALLRRKAADFAHDLKIVRHADFDLQDGIFSRLGNFRRDFLQRVDPDCE